jgi:hypothetical protein
MPRSNPGATYRRRSSDRFRSDVQFATPQIVQASVPAGTPFDTQNEESLSYELRVHQFLITALTGTNNDLAFIARDPANTSITVALVDPGGVTATLSVSVVGNAISVSLGRAASAINSTAAQVAAAIAAHSAAKELVVVQNAPGNDGTGIVTALAATPLAGPTGTTPTLDTVLETMADSTNWYAPTNAQIPQRNSVGVFRRVFGPVGWQTRINVTIGGTATPTFAMSTYVIGHR